MIQKVKDWKANEQAQFTWNLPTDGELSSIGAAPELIALRLKDDALFWIGVNYELSKVSFYHIDKFHNDMIHVEVNYFIQGILVMKNEVVEINSLKYPKKFRETNDSKS